MQNSGQLNSVSYLTCPDGSKRAYLRHDGRKEGPGCIPCWAWVGHVWN